MRDNFNLTGWVRNKTLLKENSGGFESFDWNTQDQQGKSVRLVVDTGTDEKTNDPVLRVGFPETGGTLAKFTADDILDSPDGSLQVGGRGRFPISQNLIDWAQNNQKNN